MAVLHKTQADTQAPAARAAGDAPVVRRPRPADGLELAYRTFLAGKRVEMGTIAVQLDVSQTTVYRWYGSREQLIEQVLERLARELLAKAGAEARGDGDERVLDFTRHLMQAAFKLQPVRAFVQREPQLALRLLLGESGVVRRTVTDALAEALAEARSPAQAGLLHDELALFVAIASSLQWATFAIGERPRMDDVIHLMRMMLAAGPREAHAK